MNKNDLVAKVMEKGDMAKADAAKAVEATLDAIMEALTTDNGEEVRLVGFGTFSVAKREATQGRNPRTGEAIDIPASKSPKFKPGKAFRDALNA